jgi:hemerythrin superfamily protein
MFALHKNVRISHSFQRNLTGTSVVQLHVTLSTLSATLKKDHQDLRNYANNIRDAVENDTKIRLQNQFTWNLARHAIGEELVVYPALEKYLGQKGLKLAKKDRAETLHVYSHIAPLVK